MKASLPLTAVLLAGVSIAAPLAGQQLPVFRAEANYVEVTARVVDKDGKFIEGLSAKDFALSEDHRKQTVEHVFRALNLSRLWEKIPSSQFKCSQYLSAFSETHSGNRRQLLNRKRCIIISKQHDYIARH